MYYLLFIMFYNVLFNEKKKRVKYIYLHIYICVDTFFYLQSISKQKVSFFLIKIDALTVCREVKATDLERNLEITANKQCTSLELAKHFFNTNRAPGNINIALFKN